MAIRYFSIIALVLFQINLLAQENYTFKVLVNKGKNEVKSPSGWQPIKVGSSLKQSDELKVAENSYLGLVHISGKPLEVKQSGNYKISDLSDKAKGGSSVLNKYTDFILSENTQKKNNLVATGAVHRGLGIKVYIPEGKNAVIYDSIIAINWDKEKIEGPYIVTLSSLFGDELAKYETMEDHLMIDLYDQKFKSEDNIVVVVIPKKDAGRKSDTYTIKKLSKADKSRIKTSLKEISSLLAEETALNQLYLAGFYEQNGLLMDAITSYINAIKLAPDVPAFKETYHEFLLRYKLVE